MTNTLNQPTPNSTCSLLSAATLLLILPVYLCWAAALGWNGLYHLLLGAPALLVLSIGFALTGIARRENGAFLALALSATACALAVLLVGA